MEIRKNRILLGIICLLCIVYFVLEEVGLEIGNQLPLLFLSGALLLLYATKTKVWAFWMGIITLSFWIWQVCSDLAVGGSKIAGIVILLLCGILLLKKYQKTGWESYVTPGCFSFWAGCYIVTQAVPSFNEHPCIMLLVCLFLVLYTSHLIKRKNLPIIWILSGGVIAYIIIEILLGIFY